jgi:hypothetical protein
MSAASNYTENLALTWLLTASAATRPSAWYVALFTTDPTDAGSGTEVSGTNYSRKSVTFSVTGDTATNSGAVTFDPAGTGGWGTITHIGVYDSSTAGNLLFHGAVTTSKQIDQGDTFQISTSNLSITLA